MATRPQVIKIKRKRDDKPVDRLYVESGAKRRVTEDPRIFRRVVHEAPAAIIQSRVTPSVPSAPVPPAAEDPKTSSTPRRFHLSKRAQPPTDWTPASTLQKRSQAEQDVAVFIERRDEQRKKAKGNDVATTAEGLIEAKLAPENGVAATRKRPNVNKAERQWRAGAWKVKGPSAGTPTTSEADEGLLRDMQAYAEEVEAAEFAKENADTQDNGEAMQVDAVDISQPAKDKHVDVDMLSDDGYVFDTFIHDHIGEVADGQRDGDTEPGIVGVLVIEEGDQELWQSYLDEKADSDKDWDSEDEDSNAEDYYGNDYPEDELPSDDERDEGAYNYRHGASDDEEFDTGAYSDDHNEADDLAYPWKRHPAVRRTPDSEQKDDSD